MIQRMIVSAILIAVPVAVATCESLASLKLANTSVTAAQAVEAGVFTPPGAAPAASALSTYKAFPRFAAYKEGSSRRATPTSTLRCGCPHRVGTALSPLPIKRVLRPFAERPAGAHQDD
jgi:hypothetical protein